MSVGRAFVGVGRTSKSARTRHLPLIQAPTGLKQTLSEDPSYPSSLISSSLCSLAAANITQRLMRCRRWPLRRLQQWPWQKRVKATPHWAPDSQALSSFLAMYFSTSLIPVPRLYRRGSRRARNPLHRARGPLQQPSSSANITSAGGSVTGRPKIMPLPPIYSRSAPPPPPFLPSSESTRATLWRLSHSPTPASRSTNATCPRIAQRRSRRVQRA